MPKFRCCMDCGPDVIKTCEKEGCQVDSLIEAERAALNDDDIHELLFDAKGG